MERTTSRIIPGQEPGRLDVLTWHNPNARGGNDALGAPNVEEHLAPGVPPSARIELHVFLTGFPDMQTVWFPVPAAAFFRRIVNVVSTLSISHHYLSQSRSEPDAHPPLRWPAWLARTAKFDTQCFQRILHVDSHTAYTDLHVHTADIKDPPPPNCTFFSGSRPLDQIHQLIENPALYDPVRKPRYPIVLCHGAYYMQSC